jgi:hypothetical protein
MATPSAVHGAALLRCFDMHKPDEIASKLLGLPFETLDEPTQKVARHVAGRTHIARNLARDDDVKPSAGQRAADGSPPRCWSGWR